MKRIILLNDKQFPEKFNSINIDLSLDTKKVLYVEQRIIESVNQYNTKLDVQKIEYLSIETQFPQYKTGKSNGVLIEEFDINPSLKDVYKNDGCYVYSIGNRCLCRRILLYLFISEPEEKTRTAFVSQTVFPTLLDYAESFLDSPSYSIANHGFCFINILNKKITSTMILRHLASLCAIGMGYVEVFKKCSIVPRLIPPELKKFLKLYSSDFSLNYDSSTNIYENDNYKIDFTNKIFIWNTKVMIEKLINKEKYLDFNGSTEKFYWVENLPMSIFAYNQGYTIDYSNFNSFIKLYTQKFSPKSEKFHRCETLLHYMEKYFI